MINLGSTGDTPVSSDSQTPTRKRKGVWHFFKRIFIGYCKKHDSYHDLVTDEFRIESMGKRECLACKYEWDVFVRNLEKKHKKLQEDMLKRAMKKAEEGDLTEVILRRKVTINNE